MIKILYNPIVSGILASTIFAILSALVSAAFKEGVFSEVASNIIFIVFIVLTFLSGIIVFIVRRKYLINKLVKKYADNNYFLDIFSRQDVGGGKYSRQAHKAHIRRLFESLTEDGLILESGENYPRLSRKGLKVRNQIIRK